MYWKKGILKNSSFESCQVKFAVKSLKTPMKKFNFSKVRRLQAFNFTQNKLFHRYFSRIVTVNFRAPIFQNTSHSGCFSCLLSTSFIVEIQKYISMVILTWRFLKCSSQFKYFMGLLETSKTFAVKIFEKFKFRLFRKNSVDFDFTCEIFFPLWKKF